MLGLTVDLFFLVVGLSVGESSALTEQYEPTDEGRSLLEPLHSWEASELPPTTACATNLPFGDYVAPSIVVAGAPC